MAITQTRWGRRALLAPVALGLAVVLGACQPDLFIRRTGSGQPWKGKGIINGTGEGQTETRRKPVGTAALYDLKIHNVPEGACQIALTDGALTNGGSYLRRYKVQGQNITDQVTSASGHTFSLASNAKSPVIRLRVLPESGSPGHEQLLVVTATCRSDPKLLDRVRAITKIK